MFKTLKQLSVNSGTLSKIDWWLCLLLSLTELFAKEEQALLMCDAAQLVVREFMGIWFVV